MSVFDPKRTFVAPQPQPWHSLRDLRNVRQAMMAKAARVQANSTAMSLHSAIRKASPAGLRIAVAVARRSLKDFALSGAPVRIATHRAALAAGQFPHLVIAVKQEIKTAAFFHGKLANIELGAKLLDAVIVLPGEVLSFWKLVGRPSARSGFEVGRTIRGGALIGDVGGGLCQLSGIAYEAGLRAGLEVGERFPHSRDLYAEAERFTPLGLDATVVWPYKDLRLINSLAVPVQFSFAVSGRTLLASVRAPIPLEEAWIDIQRRDDPGWRDVRVSRALAGGEAQLISHDRYVI
jgi:vancomycin resistance protein VanW